MVDRENKENVDLGGGKKPCPTTRVAFSDISTDLAEESAAGIMRIKPPAATDGKKQEPGVGDAGAVVLQGGEISKSTTVRVGGWTSGGMNNSADSLQSGGISNNAQIGEPPHPSKGFVKERKQDDLDSLCGGRVVATHHGTPQEQEGRVQTNAQQILLDLLKRHSAQRRLTSVADCDSKSMVVLLLTLALDGSLVEGSNYSDEFLNAIEGYSRSVVSVPVSAQSEESFYHALKR